MNQQNKQPEKQKKQRRFNQKQHDFLIECAKNGEEGIKRWNEWRKQNPKEEILLQDVSLRRAYLEKVNLIRAHLEGANLKNANLTSSKLMSTHLERAILRGSHMREANLKGAHLENSNLVFADLKGAVFRFTHLKGADIRASVVDESTLFWFCRVDNKTDFRSVCLDSCRIDEKTRYFLEYNIRRINWENWYKYKDWMGKCKNKRNIIFRIFMLFIKLFWSISDYGRSTGRIIKWFFGLAVGFAVIYLLFAFISPPGIVSNLSVIEDTKQIVPGWLLPLRTFYFSVVTMTTLGFGDMYANAQSIWGHILLTIQVILGYVLLGALVTRFAVLFTAGGPAGKFEDEKTICQRLKELWNKIKKKV